MKKYLIIQGARFGDILQTGRLLGTLVQRGQTSLVVDNSLTQLAALAYPQTEIIGIGLHGNLDEKILAANAKVFGQLAKTCYDAVYNCNFSPLTATICRIFERKKVIGYRPAHNSQGGILRSHWNRLAFRMAQNRIQNPINLVDHWAWLAQNPLPARQINPPAKRGGRGIGIAVAGRMARRSLSVQALAQIIEICARIYKDAPIKLFGTTTEEKKARDILHLLNTTTFGRTQNLCGRTNWQELYDNVKGLDLLITPDTGIMHLAAHLGTPVMAFFLSSALCHETGPYGHGHYIWQASPACAPCLEAHECQNNFCCSMPFADASFARVLTKALTGREIETMPPNLQLWQTDFDEFGQKMRLLAGEDEHAAQRAALRQLVMEYVHLRELAAPDSSAPYIPILEPDQEWMLPVWRYC